MQIPRVFSSSALLFYTQKGPSTYLKEMQSWGGVWRAWRACPIIWKDARADVCRFPVRSGEGLSCMYPLVPSLDSCADLIWGPYVPPSHFPSMPAQSAHRKRVSAAIPKVASIWKSAGLENQDSLSIPALTPFLTNMALKHSEVNSLLRGKRCDLKELNATCLQGRAGADR